MRNSLNAALPVTANFIDPLRSGLPKAARLSGKGCGIRRKSTVAKGSQRHRINLARRIARGGDYNLSRRAEGIATSMGPGEVISSRGCRFRKEAAQMCGGKDKVL